MGAQASLAAIVEEMGTLDDETQIIRRNNRRLVPRLARAPARSISVAASDSLSNGTILITGGLGSLGLQVATSMWQRRVAGNIILLGRTPPMDVALQQIAKLRESGAKITVAQGNVADADAMAELLNSIPKDKPLRGIVHAAGVLDDGILAEQTDRRFSKVFAPKACGAWNLHLLTQQTPLDFFVLFSSASTLSGNAGQSNYAAANAFLDALAHARRAQGLAALTINWGPWGESGMATNLSEAQRNRMLRKGMGILAPERALEAMNSALRLADPQVAIFALDTSTPKLASNDAIPPMWRSILSARFDNERRGGAERQQGTSSPASIWTERIARLSEAQRMAQVENAICADAARVLGLGSPDELRRDRPLQEQGLDSLMAVELRTAIAARIGQPLPITLVFDYPTPQAIAKFLLERVLKFHQVSTPVVSQAPRRTPSVEPIAIVGMGCRYPGGVHDANSFWQLLKNGEDAIRVIPRGRWDIDAVYDADPAAIGKMYTREAGMLDRIDYFDAGFFGISAREATWMDPQQRLLLETSWEALESAGIPAERLTGSDTGVFVGLMYHDYASMGATMLDSLEGHASTGSAGSVASGRISYVFGLQGPSLTVDTACSSSLVTLHL
ncbi:MAG TPA: SDR family NAD(P)-dependent oxidoreductase, partial [Polyangium sp.]|nr:SDR family NAD(P)-dependent oxidoreductase [Polyangium sp.]